MSEPTAHNVGDGDISPRGLSNSHSLNLEYVYHNRKMICFVGQYSRTGIDYANMPGRFTGDRHKPAVLSSLGIGLGFKLFKRENLAPYGPYVKWEFMFFSNSIDYDNENWVKSDPFPPYNNVKVKQGTGNVTFEAIGIGFSFGRQRIFFDKLIVDRGLKFMVLPTIVGSSSTTSSVSAAMEEEGIRRLFLHQLINFHIGIGFPAL